MLRLTLSLLVFFSVLSSRAEKIDLKEIHGPNLYSKKDFVLPFKDHEATVVLFISSQCGCSQSHVAHLKELAGNFKKFAFVGVISNANEDYEQAKKYFHETSLGFDLITDSKAKVADAFGAVRTPQVFVVDRTGEILFYGGVTNSSVALSASKFYLKDALKSLDKGEKPDPKEAKALGCMIQRT